MATSLCTTMLAALADETSAAVAEIVCEPSLCGLETMVGAWICRISSVVSTAGLGKAASGT